MFVYIPFPDNPLSLITLNFERRIGTHRRDLRESKQIFSPQRSHSWKCQERDLQIIRPLTSDKCPFDRSARKQKADASPNESQTAEGNVDEPV
jgi:hypothetical protein